jgi:F-type H+-transporting ATPase subunit b
VNVSFITLFGQIMTFAVLVWFIQRFLWGPLTQIMEDRRQRIADGLAAAQHGLHEKELAEQRAREILLEAKQQAAEILNRAEKRASEIVEDGKNEARAEGARLLAAARADIDQELQRARESMRTQIIAIAMQGAEKVLEREIDKAAHDNLLSKLVAEI